jgi:hypothetical protein
VTDAPPAAPVIEHSPGIERAPMMEQPPVVESAPVVEAAPRPASRPAPEPVQRDTRAMLDVAGLQMVETHRSDIPPVQPEESPVQLGRVRRERPSAAEEPLKQVETKT